jgi:hypothetical protein
VALGGGVIVDPRSKRLRSAVVPDGCLDPDWSLDGRRLDCTVGYGQEDEKRRKKFDLLLVGCYDARTHRADRLRTARDARWRPLATAARTR